MTRIALLVICLIGVCPAIGFSQLDKNGEAFWVFDKNWKPTKVNKAAYLTRLKKISDTCYQFDTYNWEGPMLRFNQYKDLECKIAHGKSAHFTETGSMDSLSSYDNGVPHGIWYTYNEKGKILMSKKFEHGELISVKDYTKPDSTKYDSAFDKGEKESEFDGGLRGWQRYLNENLRYPQRALNLKKQGETRVMFNVDAAGNVSEPLIFKSVEFSIDDEAQRIIQRSPKWTPAWQDGHYVKSYKIQPLMFRFQ